MALAVKRPGFNRSRRNRRSLERLTDPIRSVLHFIRTPTNPTKTMTRIPSNQATTAAEAQIITILSTSPRPLRQFEIADRLGLPEHHDWSTHAILKSMVHSGRVQLIETQVPTRKGSLHAHRTIKTYTETPPRTFNNRQSTQQQLTRRPVLDWMARQILKFTAR